MCLVFEYLSNKRRILVIFQSTLQHLRLYLHPGVQLIGTADRKKEKSTTILRIDSTFESFFKQKYQKFDTFRFLNVRICSFSWSYMTVNLILLGFRLLIGQKQDI